MDYETKLKNAISQAETIIQLAKENDPHDSGAGGDAPDWYKYKYEMDYDPFQVFRAIEWTEYEGITDVETALEYAVMPDLEEGYLITAYLLSFFGKRLPELIVEDVQE